MANCVTKELKMQSLV